MIFDTRGDITLGTQGLSIAESGPGTLKPLISLSDFILTRVKMIPSFNKF